MEPIQINLSKWQSVVWQDPHRYLTINCGRRAGKSTLSAFKMLDFATNNPNRIVWYISPTYRQSKAIMWEMVTKVIPTDVIARRNETELSVELINGSQIYLKGADSPDSLRGVRIDFAIFDEAAFFDRWDEAWRVIRPTLMDSKAPCWFISTPNGINHFKKLAETKDPDWMYYHFTSYDNPYLSKDEIETMRKDLDEDGYAQEVLGEFRKISGLVYKDFNRETHMVKVPDITGWTRSRAIDFGYQHKTCCLWFAINDDGSEIYAYDGFYKEGLSLDQIATAISIKSGAEYMTISVADSAQPLQIEELNQRGYYFAPIAKGPDSVKLGIQKVASLLKVRKDTGKPTLMFNQDLEWIADEFEHYRWMENRAAGFIKEVPVKDKDDALDTIRYFCMAYDENANDDVVLPDDTDRFKGRWF